MMLRELTKSQIDDRVKAINLNPKRLARMAKVDPMTVYRGAKRLKTHDAVAAALVVEEIRLLRHLLALHGVPTAQSEAS